MKHSARLDELLTAARQCYHAGDRAGTERCCHELLRLQALCPDAVYLLGVLALESNQRERALLHFHHATLLEPDRSAFHNGLGEAYRAANDLPAAAQCFREAIRLDPGNAAAHHALGLVCFNQGDLAEAVRCFRQTVAVQPNHERAYLNLGRALQAQKDLDGAIACYQEAIRLRPDYALAWNNLGAAFQAQGKHAEAVARLRTALRLQPNYPEAHHNLGNSLLVQGEPAAARNCFQEALRLRPGYARAHFGLGRALEALGDLPTAVGQFQEATRFQPDFVEAHEALGNLLLLKPDWDGARQAFERALQIQPDNPVAFARLAYTRQVLCDWRGREADLQRLHEDAERLLAAGEPSPTIPFCAMTLPWSAQFQLAVARSHSTAIARQTEPARQQLNALPSRPTGARLRIGYLSGEFRDHAVSHLMLRLFGLHDRRDFEVFGYSFGPDDGSSYRCRIAQDCDHFRDLAGAALLDTAHTIRGDGLHILIDLQGYIGFSKASLVSVRLAPLQCHYLGYPGTLGADFIDYLIGDPIVTPLTRAADFHEQLVVLPHCYLVTDGQQPVAPVPSRPACGLPERGVVFCGFGNRYKIEPRVFDVWMRLLAQLPGSVLWLSPAGPLVEGHLRREAAARGVAPERLLFAQHVAGKAEHLARHQAADLFLDTLYYNAHTTAVDALWGGLPVLTTPGETFASRVGASLLTAVGLPELIAPDLAAYERQALHLAAHPDDLRRLREQLAANRSSWPLFDTSRFVRNLERALRTMWDIHASGQPPRQIMVSEA